MSNKATDEKLQQEAKQKRNLVIFFSCSCVLPTLSPYLPARARVIKAGKNVLQSRRSCRRVCCVCVCVVSKSTNRESGEAHQYYLDLTYNSTQQRNLPFYFFAVPVCVSIVRVCVCARFVFATSSSVKQRNEQLQQQQQLLYFPV